MRRLGWALVALGLLLALWALGQRHETSGQIGFVRTNYTRVKAITRRFDEGAAKQIGRADPVVEVGSNVADMVSVALTYAAVGSGSVLVLVGGLVLRRSNASARLPVGRDTP